MTLACAALAFVGAARAEAPGAGAVFPLLTGRVVDDANLLTPQSRAALETKLKELDDKSGIQLVVATVPSLGGEEIEPYANRLFRAWKLGEAKKNNGVLLLVAPNEHKVRIEVGYGLEGTLTDALSETIITHAMTPRFKAGDFQGGIERGVDDTIAVLSTDSAEWQKGPDLRSDADDASAFDAILPFIIVFGVIVLIVYLRRRGRRRGWSGGPVFIPTGSTWTSGSNDGGSGGSSGGDSGFSGGGGSSGGGGASGDW